MLNWYKIARNYETPDRIFFTDRAIREIDSAKQVDSHLYNSIIYKIKSWPNVVFNGIEKSDNQYLSIKMQNNTGSRIIVNHCLEGYGDDKKKVLYVRRFFYHHKQYDMWLNSLDARFDLCKHEVNPSSPRRLNDLKSGLNIEEYHLSIDPIDSHDINSVISAIKSAVNMMDRKKYKNQIYDRLLVDVEKMDLPGLEEMVDKIYNDNLALLRNDPNNKNGKNEFIKKMNRFILNQFKSAIYDAFDAPENNKDDIDIKDDNIPDIK